MSKAKFELSGLATAIGSMPHVDPQEACSSVLAHLPEIPAWPQLPRKSFVENMYFQFRPSFLPQLREEVDGTMYVDMDLSRDITQDLSEELEQLYADELDNNLGQYEIKEDRRAGFDAFLEQLSEKASRPLAVKGQVIGPISWGLKVTDNKRRPALYNDVIADAIARHLKLTAAWQEKALSAVHPDTIISVDEPYLASLGSAYVSIPPEQVVALLEEVMGGIKGLKAIHCCGNTDWSVILQTSIDILSFDAYNYGQTLSLYPAELGGFLGRGGVIAWGIVPNEEQALARETEAGLLERLDEIMRTLSAKGISYDILQSQCLITPSCGLGSISTQAAARALEMTAGVSAEFRKRHYGLN
ncbi:MAG: methionine synthase [Dehalococcoidia bacterium]